MSTYSTALILLSSCLQQSTYQPAPFERLVSLIPLLPDITSPLLDELLALGISKQVPGPGQYPLDCRSSACLLALAQCKNKPIPNDLLYLHLFSLSVCQMDMDPDPEFVARLCRALCESEPSVTTTHVIRLCLQAAVQNVSLSVMLGLLQALSQPPVLQSSEILYQQLLTTLGMAMAQILQASDGRHRRRKHQWSQVQVRAIKSLSAQLQEKLSQDRDLRLSLYHKALGVLGFKDDNEWRPSSSNAISVDMYAACAELGVSCAAADKELSLELMHCLIKLLKVSLRSGSNLSPTPSNKSVFSHVLCCITRLVVNNHRLIRSAVDQLKEILENPALQQISDYEDFHELVSAAIADILKAELSIPGRHFADTFARKLVFSLDQNLLITNDDSTMNEQSLLLLLGRVTALVNNPKLTEHVIPILMNRFSNSPKFLHIVIPHLTDIALVSEARVFNDVVSLLTNIYSKPFIADNKWNRKEIPDALLNLAEHVSVPDLRSGLLKSLLKLFKILGRQIQERMEQSSVQNSSSMAGVLGFLLPALAALMIPIDEFSHRASGRSHESSTSFTPTILSNKTQIPDLMRPSPWDGQQPITPQFVTLFESVDADVKWFRTLWNYLVLYRFADTSASMWPPSWANAVKTIAAHTPALALSVTEQQQHDIELFAETGICQVCVNELRSRLSLMYPAQASVISSLSVGALVYIMTIEVLESSRVLSGTAMPLFTYLHDQTAASVTKIVDTVVDRVFQLYLDVMGTWKADSFRRQNLESHAVFLFVQSCSRYQRVAAKAAFYLKEIVSRFPFLQWSKICLWYLFELYNTLQDINSDIDLISSPGPLPSVGSLQLDLADDCKSRVLAQTHIQKMLTRWLENATFIIPSHMASMLQSFIHDWHDASSKYPALGVGISLRHLLTGKRQALLSAPIDQDQSASQLTYSMTARQRYLGEIRGRFIAFCQESQSDRPFGETMASDLLLEFHEILGRHRLGYQGLTQQFKRCLYLSAALLVWSVSKATSDDDYACQMSSIPLWLHRAVDPRELMHLVCMAPVYMFTDETMIYAIDVWSWLFTISHSFSVGLLVTMKSAWAYTVETRLCLFSPPPDQTAAQFSGCLFTRISPCYRPGWKGAGPHDSWISFLLDRFDTIADCSLGSIRAIHFMLHKALAKPENISTAPSSFGPRFRLLLLGLRLVNTRSGPDLLRDRILAAAFMWFREGPRWSPHNSWADVTADAQTIVNFIEAIRRDSGRSSNTATSIPSSSISAMSVPVANKLAVERAPSISGSIPQQAPSVMRSVRPGTESTEIFTFTTSEGHNSLGMVPDWGLHSEVEDAVSIGIRPLKDHIDLLILFLSHEYHCLIAWHNPRRHPERYLRDENLYAHNPIAGLTQDDWRRYFLVAWLIDPQLAYRLAQRFPYIRILRSMLRAKLQSEPLALKNVGEAVRLLCNQRNAKADSTILKHVAFFDSCSLPTALRFLCPPFAQNRIIRQYTLRSLSLHAHSGVIFYMPEIIQALRHDTSANLATFLKAAGTQSPHLAHQLVWALQTESVVDENARRKIQDDPLPSICAKLEQDVVSSFTDDAAAFFRAEFDFFEQVTRLSSQLLAIPKIQKEERRARLQAELLKIRTETLQKSRFPLYLPIDHTAQVVDIIIETAKPLQSAARVPFLVDFLIKKMPDSEDISESEEHTIKEKHLESSKEAVKIETKQVIFKAGDDCRQDCLALQFIRLFKDILKSIGLPLFVYPYLVIPNRTGASKDLGGVIECVRKTSSRDELGKVSGLSLRDYFLSKYGRAEGRAFKQAQRNFVLSMAGYAVCCYILQVKDRHNGNILLDEAGHVIHIDFGFIFDISPAKDMKFESAGFKLTLEMVEVMDNFDSDMWNWFVDLCVRGYLAVRAHRDDFIALAEIMSDSALGCFKPDSVRNLKHRFVPEKNERDAGQHMINVVLDAYNKFTTNTYDSIQYLQQGIYYYAGQPS